MTDFAHSPSTIRIGDLEVPRLGFGAMQIPGPMVWGEPKDPERVRAVLRRVVSLGIQLIDTSWYYGPHVSNRFIAETLHPYPKDLLIATKLGGKRTPDKGWAPFLRFGRSARSSSTSSSGDGGSFPASSRAARFLERRKAREERKAPI